MTCTGVAHDGCRHSPPESANCRVVHLEGPFERYEAAIEGALRGFEPGVELSWGEEALSIRVPDAGRLPLVLRHFTAWLASHAPEIHRSYSAGLSIGEEEHEEGGFAFLSAHRRELLCASIFLFVIGLQIRTALPWYSSLAVFILAYLAVGMEVLWHSFRSLLHGEFLDEQFLMAVASLGAFAIGEYPEAVAVMLFYQVGEAFQRRAVGKSRQAIAKMMNLHAEEVSLATADGLVTVAPEEVAPGDCILVKPGERLPLDGVVVSGHTLLDTSALTGESLPVEATEGDVVLSGAVCQTGQVTIRVTKPYCESTIARILELVQHASERKTPTERFITVFSRYYTPAVVGGALLLAILPPLLGFGEWSQWTRRALVFLVVSCPCALVISVPLSYFGGIGAASRQNILVKGSACIDALAKITTVVFDKTGTLTRGAFRVQTIRPVPGVDRSTLLEHAAHAEASSSHPIAAALRHALPNPVDATRVSEVEELAGHGVRARVDGRQILAGSRKFLEDNQVNAVFAREDGTVVHVAIEGRYAGAITIADQLKPDSADAVQALRREGVRKILMLTGDRRAVAEETAAMLGLDGFHAELLPAQKVEIVEALEHEKREGEKVAFVGDGLNDAPVLARADLGIAMGGIGSDAAVAAADAVLMTDQPSQIAVAIRIARKTLSIVRQNISFALGVKGLILILGALGYVNLWLAVFGDVGVAALATLNATRALRVGK